jgi:hypothetical protein
MQDYQTMTFSKIDLIQRVSILYKHIHEQRPVALNFITSYFDPYGYRTLKNLQAVKSPMILKI